MDGKVLFKDVLREHEAKLILDEVSVSGMLFVTVDDKLLTKHRFKNHIKIQIAFDKSVEEQKDNSQLQSVDGVNESSSNDMNFVKDNDVLVDNALREKIDTYINTLSEDAVSFNSLQTEPTFAEEESSVESQCKTIKSLREIPHPIASNSTSRPNSLAKEITNECNAEESNDPETVKITFDEGNCDSDGHGNDNDSSYDQETQVKGLNDFDNPDSTNTTRRTGTSVTAPSKLSCPYCKQSFKTRKRMFQHRRAEAQQYPCPKCNRICKHKAYLMIHMRDYHQETGPIANQRFKKRDQCGICGCIVASLLTLKNHMMIHTNEYHFQCCVCPKQFRLARDYERHMDTHSQTFKATMKQTATNSGTYIRGKIQCSICKIKVNTRSELAKHKQTHPHPCGLCGMEFSSKVGRYFHYKSAHKEDILKCPLCDRLYSDKKALGRHLKHHRNRHQTQCPVCGLFFFRLPDHMLASHPQTNSDGEPVDSFVCDKCPKQFLTRKRFLQHLKSHTKEKPYTCVECSKQFTFSGGLKKHYLAVHLQEKPHVCKVCGKACSQRGNLKVHMRVHEADKEAKGVQCSHCGENFPHKNALQEHVDKEHLEENASLLQFPQQYFQMSTFHHE